MPFVFMQNELFVLVELARAFIALKEFSFGVERARDGVRLRSLLFFIGNIVQRIVLVVHYFVQEMHADVSMKVEFFVKNFAANLALKTAMLELAAFGRVGLGYRV